MSSALALSAVTAVLQTSLQFVYNTSVFGTITVSAIAPDLVETKYGIGSGASPLVNLFLHQVTLNPAWRNMELPSLASDGITRLKNPPLALDLHYILTAYASDDTEAEGLLGYAILMLHENPILPRALIDQVLGTLSSGAYNDALKAAGLSSQFEMIKLAASTLGREEMAWLWTALKADYRPTFPFKASVVLMRDDLPAAFSLPVLTRNITVQAEPPFDQSAAVTGDTVSITGASLATAAEIMLSNPSSKINYQFAPAAGSIVDMLLAFKVPDDPANMPCGVCQVSLIFTDSTGNLAQHTNTVTLGIGLTISAPSASAAGGGTLISLTCDPQVQPGQKVSLVLGQFVATAQPFTTATASLSFQFTPALAAGTYAARLDVDGVVTPAALTVTV
jgi:Pvc16 N-terminal domain